MKNTMSNFTKTNIQGMMRGTRMGRNKSNTRTGNSSGNSSTSKTYQDKTQEVYGIGSNQSKTNSTKKQMLQSAYQSTKFVSSDKKRNNHVELNESKQEKDAAVLAKI